MRKDLSLKIHSALCLFCNRIEGLHGILKGSRKNPETKAHPSSTEVMKRYGSPGNVLLSPLNFYPSPPGQHKNAQIWDSPH
jgi:hypothetical protein